MYESLRLMKNARLADINNTPYGGGIMNSAAVVQSTVKEKGDVLFEN